MLQPFAKTLGSLTPILFAWSAYSFALPQVARADFVLSVSVAGSAPSNAPLDQPAGAMFDISFFLTQTNGESRLDSRSSGLDGAEFNVQFDRPTDLSVTSISPGPRMIDNPVGGIDSTITSDGAFISIIDDSEDGFTGAVVCDDGVNDDSILLSTLSVLIDPSASGLYEVSFTPTNSFAFTLADATGFPQPISVGPGARSFTVTAVPEPSSILFLCTLGPLVISIRRRPR